MFGMDSEYRSLTIRDHRFEPHEITVPAGRASTLRVDGFNDKDLAISAPTLAMLRIPSTQEDASPIIQSRILPGRGLSAMTHPAGAAKQF